jgi:hypothetical protein
MTHRSWLPIAALGLWIWAAAPLRAGPVLTLLPSGDLSGGPGDVLGWGFSITNDANYIEISGAFFCTGVVNYPSSCGSPLLGTFEDYISNFNDIIVGNPTGTDPATVSYLFDITAQTGIGSFTVDPGAGGGTDSGEIVLSYYEYDLDPNDPDRNRLGGEQYMSAEASVDVVPEPATAGMLGGALLIMALVTRWWAVRVSNLRPDRFPICAK